MAKIKYNDGLATKIIAGVADAVDETMAECVEEAKRRVRVDTATLQGSLRFEPAKTQGKRVIGRWGSFDVNYAIYQEIGPVTGIRIWAFTPYLRPSADIVYPELAGKIKRHAGKFL